MVRLFALLLTALLLAGCGEREQAQEAGDSEGQAAPDHIVIFSTVHVMDAARTLADAIVIEHGRIAYVGDEQAARRRIRPDSLVIEARDGALFPGFTDAHVHLIDGGETLLSLDLSEADSAAAVVAMVARYAEAHPELPVISGSGWNLPLFPNAAPDRELLDDIVPDRPVILIAADGHNAWVNSAALAAAGIDQDTPDPANGRIERDPATGEATGTLRETAMDLVAGLIPEPDADTLDRRLEAALAYMHRLGYTAAIDAAVVAGPKEEVFLRAARKGALPLRLQLSLRPGDSLLDGNASDPPPIADFVGRRDRIAALASPFLSAPQVKIFVDGVLENQTAALLQPYIELPGRTAETGDLILPEEALDAYVTALAGAGFQTHFHAIGDRAVRAALDAVEAARLVHGDQDLRPHIAHIEMIDPADITRFAELGVIANAQTLWGFEDAYISDLTVPHLGPERSARLYPFQDLLTGRATLASGSDWPVSTADPMDALEVAVTRHDPALEAGPAFLPDQRISIDDMMAALTIHGALLVHQEDVRGTLQAGKAADLVLLDADPYAAPEGKLSEIGAILTMVDGRIVWRRSEP